MSNFLNPGQMSTGPSKVFICTTDGTIRTFKEEAGGLDGKIPVANEDFTYTGEYEVLDDSDALGTWWRIKFKTSGKLIILKKFIGDIFLVGGGGGTSSINGTYCAGSGGGGGGYTKTVSNIEFTENTEYEILIGNGGHSSTYTKWTGGDETNSGNGGTGGTTSISGVDDGSIAGGFGGTAKDTSYMSDSTSYGTRGPGGNGGSGGGMSYGDYTSSGRYSSYYIPDQGASDGGTSAHGGKNNYTSKDRDGRGQGTTTREFGETFGDLYSGGGAGIYCSDTVNYVYKTNTGGAGGGGASRTAGATNTGGGAGGGGAAGGSGILIIRNHKE